MEKYFVIIPIIAVITVVLLFLVQIAFIRWTDKIFGIKDDKKNNKDKREKNN
ncbi:hypothetical protein [Thermoanaerobacter sp. YS13]|uniref:hypothetical protein n=1 Tax=Thermoanaerobacter sp. YS13 TaxID=1511746 RepID=UPI000AE58A19|nr:hypothetical protein [Thermoanaerobacter sp. YS13]